MTAIFLMLMVPPAIGGVLITYLVMDLIQHMKGPKA